ASASAPARRWRPRRSNRSRPFRFGSVTASCRFATIAGIKREGSGTSLASSGLGPLCLLLAHAAGFLVPFHPHPAGGSRETASRAMATALDDLPTFAHLAIATEADEVIPHGGPDVNAASAMGVWLTPVRARGAY